MQPERTPKSDVPGESLSVTENVASETACLERCLLFTGCNSAIYTTSQTCLLKGGSAADKITGADDVVLVWCDDTSPSGTLPQEIYGRTWMLQPWLLSC